MNGNRSRTKKLVALVVGATALVAVGAGVLLWGPARTRWSSMGELVRQLTRPPANAAAPSSPAGGDHKVLYYEDPMHPWYRSDKPGIAPDCGMKLVPVYASEGGAEAPLTPGGVQISPARQQLMGVTTAKVEYRTLHKTIRAVGQVTIDETRLVNVHVKVNGWIQKVFVDYTWQQVKKGDPLFTLYSPDLLATEQEYLLAVRARKSLSESSFQEVALGGETLWEATRRRLSLWDVTDEQIRHLEETGQPQREISFYAPATGYVLERRAYPNQYVTPETEIYKLADLSRIWVQADIYEYEAPNVSLGEEAVLTSEALPNRTLTGQLVYIYPEVKLDTRTLPVRMEFPNSDLQLKPGMFVNVELHRPLGRQLTIPADAVLDSGARQRVFVDRGDGTFEPREVKVGERTEDFVSILSGLRAGERVVNRANFLIDSESNLREAVAGMAAVQHEGQAPGSTQSSATPSAPKTTMPSEHHH